MKHARRRVGMAMALALVGVLLASVFATTAQATAYRYWTYWKVSDGAWQFAQAGPAGTTPPDGSVEGWRYAVSSTSGDTAKEPSLAAEAAFAQICADTPAVAGMKRVALVVDPGLPADAPRGEAPGPLTSTCTLTPPDGSGYRVLRSTGPVRVGGGLICAINGYPSAGCADVVDEGQVNDAMQPPATAAPAPADRGSAIPFIIGLGAVGILAGIAWLLRRRR